MDDDSNLNKNEFTALVSFAVNFHIFHAQPLPSDPLVIVLAAVAARWLSSERRARETARGANDGFPAMRSHTGFWKNLSSLVC